DVRVAAEHARCTARNIRQDAVESAPIPPLVEAGGVGNASLRAQAQSLEGVAHSLQSHGLEVECQQVNVGEFENMGGLATRSRAGVEDALTIAGGEQGGGVLRPRVLHGQAACGESR